MKAKSSIQKLSTSKTITGGLLSFTLALGLSFYLDLGPDLGLGPGGPLPCFASISQDDRLAKLEVKFFKHTYPKDDDGARLDRLEKMIFGEARSGSDEDRLKSLASTVPNLNDLPADADAPSPSASAPSSAGESTRAADNPAPAEEIPNKVSNRSSGKKGAGGAAGRGAVPAEADDDSPGAHKVLAGESKYPAVTALEQHLFHRDYATEAVGDRLNRLETKVFGKPSRFTDLSERVDALKDKTNIDIAKQPPSGTDWTDDDEDTGRAFPVPKRSEPIARTDGDDGKSFSGRDIGQDLRKAFGYGASGVPGGQPSGAYGMSGTSAGRGTGNSASGAYGMGSSSSSGAYSGASSNLAMAGGPSNNGAPVKRRASRAAAPSTQDDDDTARPPVNPLGLSQQVTSLETAVLGKTYNQEPLIDRVARLEKSVFPKEADAQKSLAMPDRVARLLQKVPIASQTSVTSAGRRSSRSDSGATSSASRHRPSGWIDEDNNLGFGSGSSSGSGGSSADLSDESFATGQGGMGGMSSMGTAMGMGTGLGVAGGMPQQTAQKPGGLSKIINSIGNALNGGFTGGYNVNSSNLRTDPATGLLVDVMTGNLINPTTGAVVGRSASYGGTPLYSGIQTGGMGGLGGMGMGGMGMGGLGMGGLGMGGLGMGGLGMGMGMGGLGGGIPYGGMPYGGMPYGYGGGMPMGGINGFNNGFSSPYGMGGMGAYGGVRRF